MFLSDFCCSGILQNSYYEVLPIIYAKISVTDTFLSTVEFRPTVNKNASVIADFLGLLKYLRTVILRPPLESYLRES